MSHPIDCNFVTLKVNLNFQVPNNWYDFLKLETESRSLAFLSHFRPFLKFSNLEQIPILSLLIRRFGKDKKEQHYVMSMLMLYVIVFIYTHTPETTHRWFIILVCRTLWLQWMPSNTYKHILYIHHFQTCSSAMNTGQWVYLCDDFDVWIAIEGQRGKEKKHIFIQHNMLRL